MTRDLDTSSSAPLDYVSAIALLGPSTTDLFVQDEALGCPVLPPFVVTLAELALTTEPQLCLVRQPHHLLGHQFRLR